MINLKFMNEAVEIAEGNEFRLLYVIANTISLKKEGHTKIYREMLADKLGLSTKQITRLTNSLVEKGLLKKDLVSENGKTVCYYALNLDKSVTKTTSKLDKNVPLNKSKKELLKEKRNNKSNKSEKEEKNEIKREFKTECNEDLKNIEHSTDDFDYALMNQDLLEEAEKAIDETLIPMNIEGKRSFTTKCYV